MCLCAGRSGWALILHSLSRLCIIFILKPICLSYLWFRFVFFAFPHRSVSFWRSLQRCAIQLPVNSTKNPNVQLHLIKFNSFGCCCRCRRHYRCRSRVMFHPLPAAILDFDLIKMHRTERASSRLWCRNT